MTTKKSFKEIENEKSRGRKRYLERIQETKDAEEEIKGYQESPEQLELPFDYGEE